MERTYQSALLSILTIAIISSSAFAEEEWPRVFESDGRQITVYQPQVDHWNDGHVEEHAAVSVQSANSTKPTYGVFWFTARTHTNQTDRVVTLEDIQISRVSFPSQKERAEEYLRLLKENTTPALKTVSLDRMRASLAISDVQSKRKLNDVKNEPPTIFFSEKPSVLVLIDGPSTLRDTTVESVERVINTRALLLFNKSEGIYYLSIANHWVSAASPRGPWTDANPSEKNLNALEKVKASLADDKQIDFLNDLESDKSNSIPHVYSSTEPAELIETKGKPQMEPIVGTQLLFVQNSTSDIFMNTVDQNYYVTLSGRWFRAKSLDGNWNYVSGKELPSDFAKIPENHPKGEILASVPGTPDANEAQITNEIPQTATVERSEAKLNVTYDGRPNFIDVSGTNLQYAPNSATPVIRVSADTYYAVEHGVWFVGMTPEGPWSIATSVPQQIYAIPPSSPIYNVTYVYIYDSSPRYVYVGYLPGYLGTFCNHEGVVVYGTGYYHRPWVHHVWYGTPITYGIGFRWGPERHIHHYPIPIHRVVVNPVNVYQNWGGHVVHTPPPTMIVHSGIRTNIQSDRPGNVFRPIEHPGWPNRSENHAWQNIPHAPSHIVEQSPVMPPHAASPMPTHVTMPVHLGNSNSHFGGFQEHERVGRPIFQTPVRPIARPNPHVAPPHFETTHLHSAPPQSRSVGENRKERNNSNFRR